MSPQQELGTATRCLSDKRFWAQEVEEALRDLGVTLIPGHQEGKYYGLLPAWVTSSQVLREETGRGAARTHRQLGNVTFPSSHSISNQLKGPIVSELPLLERLSLSTVQAIAVGTGIGGQSPGA